jgi:hypothetical protein
MHSVIGYIMAGPNSDVGLGAVVVLPQNRLGITWLKDVATTIDNGENTLETRQTLAQMLTQRGSWVHWLNQFDLVTIAPGH